MQDRTTDDVEHATELAEHDTWERRAAAAIAVAIARHLEIDPPPEGNRHAELYAAWAAELTARAARPAAPADPAAD